MIILAPASISATATAAVAALLMIVAGAGMKRLRWRTVECPVCHHQRPLCMCGWL